MKWIACVCMTALNLVPAALAEDDASLRDALALQTAMQAAIRQAEPSIACILVSRSDGYRQFGRGAAPDIPGLLGEFYADQVATPPLPGGAPDSIYEKARRLDLSDPSIVPESYGSGVVVDQKARLVLTNYHVVRDATKVFVRLPGEKGSYANIHAADGRSDLAVLQLIGKDIQAPAIKMGDGRAAAKGQFVLSLANPFAAGFRDGSPSASWGIISNIRRRAAVSPTETDVARLTLPQFNTLLEIDARLNLGCSGGAIINLRGEMIGLTNTLAALGGTEMPAGYALPMDANIKAIVETLKRGEEVEYGFLGVGLPTAERRGVGYTIGTPVQGSPAERAGLHAGDTILSINGARIRDRNDLFVQIGMSLAGSTIHLEVLRDSSGSTTPHTAVLAKADVPMPFIASRRYGVKEAGGLRVDYTSVLAQRTHMPYMPPGVVIREVQPGSAADRAHLQADRIITHVNGRPVNTPTEFYREFGQSKGSAELLLDSQGRRPAMPERIKLEWN